MTPATPAVRRLTSRQVALTAAFLALAAGGVAACDDPSGDGFDSTSDSGYGADAGAGDRTGPDPEPVVVVPPARVTGSPARSTAAPARSSTRRSAKPGRGAATSARTVAPARVTPSPIAGNTPSPIRTNVVGRGSTPDGGSGDSSGG